MHLPPLPGCGHLILTGEVTPHPEAAGIEKTIPTLDVFLNGKQVAKVETKEPGEWKVNIPLLAEEAAQEMEVSLILRDVAWTNFLAWAGRVGEKAPGGQALQRFRKQNKNRQMRVVQLVGDGEVIFDFSNRHAPYATAFARRHADLGFNIVGYFTAELGIGESARCMLRAAQAAELPHAAVELRLPCKATRNDETYAHLLRPDAPYPVNVVHVDAPGGADLTTHHGKEFRTKHYNVGYWAWELPEFPDAWMPYFEYFDEIWCPSDFVRSAIAEKSPCPVLTFPHSIAFARPVESMLQLRTRLGLPIEKYLFLFLYDLNSYAERKNPRAVIEAFRLAQLAQQESALIIKVHGARGNEKDLAALREAVKDLPGTVLITEAYSRKAIYDLQEACDCFVSLHRSEGFGLAVAECMYLGKPVIATDWSATREMLNETNGCPVRNKLVMLDRNHGPYSKGQFWAEPDIAHAAEWMQRLREDPSLGHILGTAARATIETQFSPAVIGARYRRRLETIASW